MSVPAQTLSHKHVRIYVPHREAKETQGEEQMLTSKTSQPANVTLNLPPD